jgi:hypothetical protein
MMAAQALWSPSANGTLMARRFAHRFLASDAGVGTMRLSCGFVVERVTRIELALSAWEVSATIDVRPAYSATCTAVDQLPAVDRQPPPRLT